LSSRYGFAAKALGAEKGKEFQMDFSKDGGMSSTNRTDFGLNLTALPELQSHVLRFSGKSRLNSLYSIEITVAARASELIGKAAGDFYAGEGVLRISDVGRPGAKAAGTGAASAWEAVWHGMVTGFCRRDIAGDWAILEITLEPTLSRLTGQIQSRIHLDSSACEAVSDSMAFGGMAADRFRFDLDAKAYPKRDFAFQHEEDLGQFVLRTLEHEGIGLRFDQTLGRDVAVMTDLNSQFPPLKDGGKELEALVSDVSGMDAGDGSAMVFGLRMESRVPKASVRLKDYNWLEPNKPLEALMEISPYGRGELYLYGENFHTEGEGMRLAAIRRGEELWKAESFRATSFMPGLMPGLTLNLKGAKDESFDGRYLIAADEMRGSRPAGAAAALGVDPAAAGLEGHGEFVHDLTLSRIELPYRPSRVTPKPKIAGNLTAWIDGAGSGDAPETDGYGRYKVLFPLDVSGRSKGKASPWIRMAQPYTGVGYGQNFPLTPGAEVLVAFVDGNPDRPVIMGSVANAETVPVVNSATPHLSGIGTKGGGGIIFGNKPEKQNVTISGGGGGHIALAAGSPSSAAIYADLIGTVSVVNNLTSTFVSNHTSGFQHTVKVSDDWINNFMTILANIRQGVGGAGDIAKVATAFRDDDGGRDNKDATGITYNASEIVDLCTSPIQAIAHILLAMKLSKKIHPTDEGQTSFQQKDTNLISIIGDDKGATTTWMSKSEEKKKLPWSTILNVVLMGVNPTRDTLRAVAQTKTLYTEINDDDDDTTGNKKKSDARKRSAKSLSYISPIASVITDVISIVTLWRSMWSSPQRSTIKGILVSNEDSYVNILAKTWAGVSAGGGPLVLESNDRRAADDMRCTFPATPPAGLNSCVSPEPSQRVQPAVKFMTSRAVLLHGKIVRTLCDELSLTAKEKVVVKTPGFIKLVTGNETAVQPPAAPAVQPPAASVVQPPIETPGLDKLAARNVNIDYSVGMEKGIELVTKLKDENILIRTENSGASLTLASGFSNDIGASRSIVLDDKSVKLTRGGGVELSLEEKSAKLSRSNAIFLELGDKDLKISHSGNNFLSFSEDNSKLSHNKKLSLFCSTGKAGIEISTEKVSITSQIKAEVNGKVIILGA
jgi:type VI secretion system VgrG family protein